MKDRVVAADVACDRLTWISLAWLRRLKAPRVAMVKHFPQRSCGPVLGNDNWKNN
jgi:hypothetical protein